MYEKVSTNLNFVEREKKVEQFWKDEQIFQKSMALKGEGKDYVFYDGPPTANGKPHIGHVLTRCIKDLIPRYRTMKGCTVPRKAGWDPRPAGRDRGRKAARARRQRADRTVRSGAVYRKVQGKRLEVQGHVGGFLLHRRLLGGYG